jgi:iron complex transport system substrate-binding protein
LVPAVTEILCALGLADRLAGVSEGCDHPADVSGIQVIRRPEPDGGNGSLLVVRDLLREIRPDLIFAPGPALPEDDFPEGSRVIRVAPRTLEDVFETVRAIGAAAGVLEKAKDMVYHLRARALAVQCRAYGRQGKPRVMVLDRVEPLRLAGLWTTDMVDIAGGLPDHSLEGCAPVDAPWERVIAFAPDVLLVAPRGAHLAGSLEEADRLRNCPVKERVGAFMSGRVFAVDAEAYVVRPGPRLVEGIELMAHLFHPDAFRWGGAPGAFQAVRF